MVFGLLQTGASFVGIPSDVAFEERVDVGFGVLDLRVVLGYAGHPSGSMVIEVRGRSSLRRSLVSCQRGVRALSAAVGKVGV